MSKCGLNRCCVDWMTVQKHMLSKTSLSLIIDDLLKILEVQDFRNDWLHSVRIENYASLSPHRKLCFHSQNANYLAISAAIFRQAFMIAIFCFFHFLRFGFPVKVAFRSATRERNEIGTHTRTQRAESES